MRRMNDERGATAIFTAIVIVMLMGFAALAVDVGALWWDKKELQNGADAAALALAQSCAEADGATGCENDRPMATDLAEDNKTATLGVNEARIPIDGIRRVDAHGNPDPHGNYVSVTVTGQGRIWFSAFLGAGPSDVSARATASWGPVGSARVLPLAISLCELLTYGVPSGAGEIVVLISDDATGCHPDGAVHEAPGGWGWLVPESTPDCTVVVDAGAWADSKTGKPIPTGCDGALQGLQGKTVLMPVFDRTNGLTGSNAKFHLIGFAQLEVEAYCFGNHIKYTRPGDLGCPSKRWIAGRFVQMVDLSADTGDGENFGATTVRLTG